MLVNLRRLLIEQLQFENDLNTNSVLLLALLTSRHLSFDIKPIRVHVRKAPISDLFSSLCARVFSRPAAILKAEKTLGTRLFRVVPWVLGKQDGGRGDAKILVFMAKKDACR